jgi:hypothetical protein
VNPKYVRGTVDEVLTDTSGRRASVRLKVKRNLPGHESRKSIYLRSAHAGEAPHSFCASRELTFCDPSPVRSDGVEEEVAGRQDEGAPYNEGTPYSEYDEVLCIVSQVTRALALLWLRTA